MSQSHSCTPPNAACCPPTVPLGGCLAPHASYLNYVEPDATIGGSTVLFHEGCHVAGRVYAVFLEREVQNSVGSSLVTPAKAGVQYGERWLLACGFPLSRE